MRPTASLLSVVVGGSRTLRYIHRCAYTVSLVIYGFGSGFGEYRIIVARFGPFWVSFLLHSSYSLQCLIVVVHILVYFPHLFFMYILFTLPSSYSLAYPTPRPSSPYLPFVSILPAVALTRLLGLYQDPIRTYTLHALSPSSS